MLYFREKAAKRRLRELPEELAETAKKPRVTPDVLASFANPSIRAHMLQHAIAAKRRWAQRKSENRNLFGLWRIVNTKCSLQALESRYVKERFAREWKMQWGSQPKRSAGQFMKEEVLCFQDCFKSAQKTAERAKDMGQTL